MFVSKEKTDLLNARMEKLAIQESDIKEKFIQGGGPGGQKINKTSSTVYICHIPTGIEIKCSKSRSLSLNRYYARCELCDRIAQEIFNEKTKKQMELKKIKRQKKRRSRKQKARMLEEKHKNSEKKILRKRVSEDE